MNPFAVRDKLLEHVVQITRHRNRGEIEACVLQALHDLMGAKRAAFYKIYHSRSETLVGQTISIASRGVPAQVFDDLSSWPPNTRSIENEPQKKECLMSGGMLTQTAEDWSWLVLLKNASFKPYSIIELICDQKPEAADVAFASNFGLLLQNALAMLDYGETDSLTGLLNRKSFDEYLASVLATAPDHEDVDDQVVFQPNRRTTAEGLRDHWLAVIDIDHFKQVNDKHGHLVGDEVLISFANLMHDCFRSQDVLFRFGGEEFVVLLRPTQLKHAARVFERFRDMVASHTFPVVGKITVSIGFTRIRLGDTPLTILDSADEAMYWVKQHGRNNSCAYETLLAEGKLPGLRSAPHALSA